MDYSLMRVYIVCHFYWLLCCSNFSIITVICLGARIFSIFMVLWLKLGASNKGPLVDIRGKKYCKFPKYSDTQKNCCSHSKILTMWLYHRVMSPKDADGMANSVDLVQTAPLGAVWSGSALFAQAYLPKNLGPLRYQGENIILPFCSSFQICYLAP